MSATWQERKGTTVLTLQEVCVLADVVRAAQAGKRAQWLPNGDLGSRALDGVVRSIGTDRGDFLRADEDVRDAYLRISSTFEHFLPMAEVCSMVRNGTMVFE